ncbi:phage tail protein [Sporolactobacillus sp. CQH2019]|uniref:phage tail spike protein n=1 Tax=Sporolactobacillus sp. CQH2019 TaxID=3023512 RepID=UPI0023675A4C|nr:phage tail spike protein [Sporolactobacillus sp. CQH2019]MDD9147820.1 phage tail protein [Sporolactobacillus sp. CQH2019]
MIYILTPDKKVVAVLDNDGGLSCPFWADLHVEKMVDFDSTYTFTAPADRDESQYLVVGNYAALVDMDNDIQLFRMINVADGFDSNGKTIVVNARNEAIFDLNGTIIRPHTFTGMMAADAFSFILQDSGWEMGTCDIISSIDFSIDSYSTAQAALHTVADTYSGDVKFRVEIQGNHIIHQYVDFLQKRGTNHGKRFEYAKDIQGLTRTIDIDNNFATALIPQGAADSVTNNPIDITSVNNGLDYIANDDANRQFNPGSDKYIYKIYTNDKKTTPAALLADAKVQLAIVSKPTITYDAQVILLQMMAGYEHEKVSLGDTVGVVNKDMNPTLTVQARIIELDISYSDHSQDKATLGDYVPLQDVTPTMVQKIQQQVKNTLSGMDLSNIKVELAASNGNTFKNGQGTTDLIARVYNGKTPITSDLRPENFVWYKMDVNGTHDAAWEQAHVAAGNTVTVTAADVTTQATFECDISI